MALHRPGDVWLDHPAVGRPLIDLPTPAPIVDLSVLENNIATMAAFFRNRPARLRPHAKTHRAPAVARLQVAAGAVGVTCAKVGMAEAMVDGGINDVYIANQVVSRQAIDRLARLATRARVAVAVDNPGNVVDLSAAAVSHRVVLHVLVEVDAGMGRCGVPPGVPALTLAQMIGQSPGLAFEGLHAYEGHVVSASDPRYRKVETHKMLDRTMSCRDLILANGLPVPTVTCGGTGTYDISGVYSGVTEHQAGSYVYMDPNYRRQVPAFGLAFSVLCTVTSHPSPDRVITDGGLQVLAADQGAGEVKDHPELVSAGLSEEHGKFLVRNQGHTDLRVGDVVQVYPSHCDSAVNLHDVVFAARGGFVEAVWRVTARGRST